MRKLNTAQRIILVIGLIALAIRCFTYEPIIHLGGFGRGYYSGVEKKFNYNVVFHCLGIISATAVLMLIAGFFGRLEPVPLLHKVETCIYSRDVAEMLYIPAGEFIMGTSDDQIKELLRQFPSWKREWFADEQPQHRVIVDDFYIDRYPVTNAQFEQFVKATGYKAEGYWREYYTKGKGSHPVVMVSWNDASAYCQWAGKRLPTEAEWEKAARVNDGRIWPWGNAWDNSKCNSQDGGPGTTTPVGSYLAGASPYGVMDMGGNVWEWCADWYDGDYYASASNRNPQGPSSWELRVLRGGSWYNDPFDVRAANRDGYTPESRFAHIGFRCTSPRFP